jgi:hypothetical protein
MNWLECVARMRGDFEELRGELFGGRLGRASWMYCRRFQIKEWKALIEPIVLKTL